MGFYADDSMENATRRLRKRGSLVHMPCLRRDERMESTEAIADATMLQREARTDAARIVRQIEVIDFVRPCGTTQVRTTPCRETVPLTGSMTLRNVVLPNFQDCANVIRRQSPRSSNAEYKAARQYGRRCEDHHFTPSSPVFEITGDATEQSKTLRYAQYSKHSAQETTAMQIHFDNPEEYDAYMANDEAADHLQQFHDLMGVPLTQVFVMPHAVVKHDRPKPSLVGMPDTPGVKGSGH